MSFSELDRIVKATSQPGTFVPEVVSGLPVTVSPLEQVETGTLRSTIPLPPSDPLAALPSSPPQIYLNLLILEASLRSQYLILRARRRQHTFFLLVLTIWITCFFYALFLRPREDGRGVGGSVYWVVEMAEKVALMGGIVTGILLWGTGQWDRGVRWPRRWIGVANRGLRSVNAKVVVIKGSWWKEMQGHMAFLFPFSSILSLPGPSLQYPNSSMEKRGQQHPRAEFEETDVAFYEEDLSPGGDYIKVLLLPKPFSPDFRENWELYRIEYWEKENERRARLRQILRQGGTELAREQGGWLRWIGWRGWRRARDMSGNGSDIEKIHSRHHMEREAKQRPTIINSASHSRTASRSSTPTSQDFEGRPSYARVRRGSSNSSANERRKKAKFVESNDDKNMLKLTSISSRPRQ